MIHEVLYSSRSEEWPTPRDLFELLDREFQFTLDPCAPPENAKCAKFFTRQQDGLIQDWGDERVFCNPPYGKRMRDWARKCFDASRTGATVILLAHARTDTRWFHDWVYGIRSLSPESLWRHNVAGDLPSNNRVTIDRAALRAIVDANKGRRGFTFTRSDLRLPHLSPLHPSPHDILKVCPEDLLHPKTTCLRRSARTRS